VVALVVAACNLQGDFELRQRGVRWTLEDQHVAGLGGFERTEVDLFACHFFGLLENRFVGCFDCSDALHGSSLVEVVQGVLELAKAAADQRGLALVEHVRQRVANELGHDDYSVGFAKRVLRTEAIAPASVREANL
jgi:hypothetical protein